MYKVIFADDEKLVRERISKLIQWEEFGFSLVSCCANGHEVMEAIENEAVDLAVLDINMPFINGLEAAAQIKNSYPNTQIVFLTGYTEFEYAAKAIEIGVHKYIVKPVSADDFRAMLTEVKTILDAENVRIHKVATLEQQQQKSRDVLLQDLIKETGETIYARVQAQGFAWDAQTSFAVAVLQVDEKQSGESSWKADEQATMQYALANVLGELAEEQQLGYAYQNEGEVVLIGAGRDAQKLEIAMQACLTQMVHLAQQTLHFTISAGLGGVQHGCEHIHASYKEATRAGSLRIRDGGNKIYTAKDLNQNYSNYTVVLDAIAYINAQYAVPDLSVDAVSAHLHISPGYLRTLFKQQTESSVIGYITKTRMEKALELLQDSTMKNATIAQAIGYTDARYFSYCFKRYYGMTIAEKRATL